MAAVCEAMSLGYKLGLETGALTEIINTSSGRCWSSDSYHPVPGVMENTPSSRNYENGFNTDLMVKDLGLAINAAQDVGAELPMGKTASDLYRRMSAAGNGRKDFSGLYRFFYDADNTAHSPGDERQTKGSGDPEIAARIH